MKILNQFETQKNSHRFIFMTSGVETQNVEPQKPKRAEHIQDEINELDGEIANLRTEIANCGENCDDDTEGKKRLTNLEKEKKYLLQKLGEKAMKGVKSVAEKESKEEGEDLKQKPQETPKELDKKSLTEDSKALGLDLKHEDDEENLIQGDKLSQEELKKQLDAKLKEKFANKDVQANINKLMSEEYKAGSGKWKGKEGWNKKLTDSLGMKEATPEQQQAAVKAFQRSLGVEVDGKFGPKTRAAFFRKQNEAKINQALGIGEDGKFNKNSTLGKQFAKMGERLKGKTPAEKFKILSESFTKGMKGLKGAWGNLAEQMKDPNVQRELMRQIGEKMGMKGDEFKKAINSFKGLSGKNEGELTQSEKASKGKNLKFSLLRGDSFKPFKSQKAMKLPSGTKLREGKFGETKSLDFPKKGLMIKNVSKAKNQDVYVVAFGENIYASMTKEQLGEFQKSLTSKSKEKK